jgi:hypothetical protein
MKIIINEHQFTLLKDLLLERGETPNYGGGDLINNLNVGTTVNIAKGDPTDWENIGTFNVTRINGNKVSLLNQKDNKVYVFDFTNFDNGHITTGKAKIPIYVVSIKQKGRDLHFSPKIYEPDPSAESMEDDTMVEKAIILKKLEKISEGSILRLDNLEFMVEKVNGDDIKLDVIEDGGHEALRDPELSFYKHPDSIIIMNNGNMSIILNGSNGRKLTLKNIKDISLDSEREARKRAEKEQSKDAEAREEKEREKEREILNKRRAEREKEEARNKQREIDRAEAKKMLMKNPRLIRALKHGIIPAEDILKKIYSKTKDKTNKKVINKKFNNRTKILYQLNNETIKLGNNVRIPFDSKNKAEVSKKEGSVILRSIGRDGRKDKKYRIDVLESIGGDFYKVKFYNWVDNEEISEDGEIKILNYDID